MHDEKFGVVSRLPKNRNLRWQRTNLFFLVSLCSAQKNRFDIAYISDLGDFLTAHILTFPFSVL